MLASCVKDKPPVTVSTLPTDSKGVYVVCEGIFTTGTTAGLYLYNRTTDSVYGDLFKGANGSYLGDVFQSMVKIDSHLFMAVNNSHKIIVADAATYRQIATISIPFPRNILPVSTTAAYVSTLYDNKVYVINTTSYAIVDSILLPSLNPEGMYLANNSAIVCSWDTVSKNVYQIDVAANTIRKTFSAAGYAPTQVLADKNQLLWVLSGNQPDKKTAALTQIDPSTGDVIKSMVFPATANPIKLCFNATKDTLYFIEADYYNTGTSNNGIFRMGINEPNLPASPIIAAGANQYFYALGIDPATGYIYVGDPKGFNQSGIVTIYRTDATIVSSFRVGIGPGAFVFE